MDVSAITTSNVSFDLKHPGTGAPLGIKIELRPNDHPSVEEARSAYLAHQQHAARKGEELSIEEITDASGKITLAAVESITFSGEANWNGETDYGPDLAAKMVATKWVRKQIDKKLANESAFFGG
jgi:hypothetical protein